MWLSSRVRQSFAMAGLLLSGAFAYVGIENHWFLIPAVLAYGLTKLGIHLIPWRS